MMLRRRRGAAADVVAVASLDALGLVVRSQSENDAHDAFQIAFHNLLTGDVRHANPLGGHELQNTVQVLAHDLGRVHGPCHPCYVLAGCVGKRGWLKKVFMVGFGWESVELRRM